MNRPRKKASVQQIFALITAAIVPAMCGLHYAIYVFGDDTTSREMPLLSLLTSSITGTLCALIASYGLARRHGRST